MKIDFKRIRVLHEIAVILFILFSCEYEPKGEYKTEVTPVNEAPALYVQFNFETDTIIVPSLSYVSLEYSTNDPLVRYGYFELDNKQLGRVFSYNGICRFQFNPELYRTDVPYALKIEFFRSSGSGSLADKYNQEGFLYSKDFVLIFTNQTDFLPKIIRPVFEDGSLKMRWEKFHGIGFKKYHVFNGDYKIAEITDQNTISCFDPSFIGYGAFRVVVETDYGTFSSSVYDFDDIRLSAEGSKISDNELLIRWNKNKYVNNLAGYRIYRYIQETGEENEVAFITDPMDTTFLTSLDIFAVNIKYYIKPVAEINDIPVNDSGDLQAYAAGTEYFRMGGVIPAINWFLFEKSPDNYCFYPHYSQYTVVYKMSPGDHIIIDSLPDIYPHVSLSPDGKKLTILRNNMMQILNPVDMSVIAEIQPALLPEGILPMQFVISDTNISVIVTESGSYFYYDFTDNTVLAELKYDNGVSFGDRMKISSDGMFFCVRYMPSFQNSFTSELYKLEGDKVKQLWTDKVSFFEFDPNTNDFLYLSNNKLYTISTVSMEIVKELNIEDEYLYDIDWTRREFLSLNDERNRFSICDLGSGLVKANVETRNFSGFWNYQTVYLNDKTIFMRHLKLRLDYN